MICLCKSMVINKYNGLTFGSGREYTQKDSSRNQEELHSWHCHGNQSVLWLRIGSCEARKKRVRDDKGQKRMSEVTA
jgi:hypothetical protein